MTNQRKTLTVVTGNASKAAEIGAITGWPVEAVKLDILEIQSLDLEQVAREKALAAYRAVGKPVVVDDTGMTISALNGLPGPFVAWFLDQLKPQGILDMVQGKADRRAEVATCIGYADEHGAHTFLGTVAGTITTELRGEGGFGYDPIFIPDGQTKTYAEMTIEEKNAISMRSIALGKLRDFLNQSENQA